MSNVYYEWCLETMEGEDIVDNHHEDRLADLPPQESNQVLVLIRNDHSGKRTATIRAWAYVKDGKLPEYFEDALDYKTDRVPKRFHEELAKHQLVTA